MIQKKLGNQYEKKLLQILQGLGYWCHLFSYDANGQPCDIIAFDDVDIMLIDVKHCQGDRFYTSRVEPNQSACFKYAKSRSKNATVGFAIYFETLQKWKWLDWSEDMAVSYRYNELEFF